MNALTRLKCHIASKLVVSGLALHVRDGDAYAVHHLASGGRQLARDVLETLGKPIPEVTLDVSDDARAISNALKHYDIRRYDQKHLSALAEFDEEINDFYIDAGIRYLEQLQCPLSEECRVFIRWFEAVHRPDGYLSRFGSEAPQVEGKHICNTSRDQQ
ncbi:MAG: hypothetical protein ROR55_12720 [Devosia sp.]